MPQRVRNWLAVFCGWTALALFFAVSNSLAYLSTGRPGNWALSIRRSLLEWWLWALLTPIIVWLARRFPLERPWRWRKVLVHALAGVALAVLKAALERAAFAWMTGVWTYWLVSTLALQFFVYCAVVAAAHSAVYYERSRERDQLAARLADVRLQLLSMQLQPHFLFNTLNTIAELVHSDPHWAQGAAAPANTGGNRTTTRSRTIRAYSPLGHRAAGSDRALASRVPWGRGCRADQRRHAYAEPHLARPR